MRDMNHRTSTTERKLRTFENEIWTAAGVQIFDDKKKVERFKSYSELLEEMEMASAVSFVRDQRIQWLGLWRRDEDDTSRVVLERNPTEKRPRGWPRIRWLDAMEKDLVKT